MFRRRTTPSASEVSDGAVDPKSGGKGRATPTRKEAEAARKQRLTAAPRTRKEKSEARRTQVRASRERQRLALMTGDDAYLPARDKGPVKRYARDFVDSRWCIGEVLLPLFFVVFAVLLVTPAVAPSISRFASLAWLIVLVLMFSDAVRVVRGVRAGIRARFSEVDTKGVSMYAVLRAWQMRRLRLPKPMKKHGDPV